MSEIEVVDQLASLNVPSIVPAQQGWRLVVLGPDEDAEACPVVAWELRGREGLGTQHLAPFARAHAQSGYLSVKLWAGVPDRVVGILAPSEEMDSAWYESAADLAKAIRDAEESS